jgi:trafficking protein particle complex subunit 2
MGSIHVFVIVGCNDHPVYEVELTSFSQKKEGTAHLNQLIVHSALDVVDEVMWNGNAMYLRAVDRFKDVLVSAYITAGRTRFMLLHDARNEDAIKNFFQEVHEHYLKTIMNPFYGPNMPITSSTFDARVKQAAKKYF